MSRRDLEPLRQAAEEVGLTTTEPVFYEVITPANNPFGWWWFEIVACSLDGTRREVWSGNYKSRRRGKRRAARHARRLAAEADNGPLRVWIGEQRRRTR